MPSPLLEQAPSNATAGETAEASNGTTATSTVIPPEMQEAVLQVLTSAPDAAGAADAALEAVEETNATLAALDSESADASNSSDSVTALLAEACDAGADTLEGDADAATAAVAASNFSSVANVSADSVALVSSPADTAPNTSPTTTSDAAEQTVTADSGWLWLHQQLAEVEAPVLEALEWFSEVGSQVRENIFGGSVEVSDAPPSSTSIAEWCEVAAWAGGLFNCCFNRKPVRSAASKEVRSDYAAANLQVDSSSSLSLSSLMD